MVRDQIESRGIKNPDVLRVMRAVPRHLFVAEETRMAAYSDHALPIGHGQTISQPYVVARMTDLLQVKRDHSVLEIGTGSGYQAAVLSLLSRQVYTIELTPELAASAADRLRVLGYANVSVRTGDGYLGWPEKAPFDRIIVTAAPPAMPAALVAQLKPSARLVAPVGMGTQYLTIIDKRPDGTVRESEDIRVMFVPMRKPPTA